MLLGMKPPGALPSRRVPNHLLLLPLAALIAVYLLQWPMFVSELHDWGSFIDSARAASNGMNPYAAYTNTNFCDKCGETHYAVNLNPPFALFLFQPFAAFDLQFTQQVWLFLSVGFYLLSLGILSKLHPHPNPLRWIWALALTGFWHTLVNAQIYTLLLLIAVGALWCLECDRSIWAAILIGVLVALKPNFAPWPAMLFLASYRRLAVQAAGVAALCTGAALLVYGPSVLGEWLVVARSAYTSLPLNVSIVNVFTFLGWPLLGTALTVVVVVYAGVWSLVVHPSARQVASVALIISILSSPISWPGYTLFALPALCERKVNAATAIVSVGLLTPVIWTDNPVAWMPLSLAVMLLFVVTIRRTAWRPSLVQDSPRPVAENPD